MAREIDAQEWSLNDWEIEEFVRFLERLTRLRPDPQIQGNLLWNKEKERWLFGEVTLPCFEKNWCSIPHRAVWKYGFPFKVAIFA